MYDNMTDYNIRKEMLDKVTAPVSKTEGTLIYDALSPVANEFAKQYMELDSMLLKSFIQSTYEDWLDKKGSEFGVYRKQPTKAIGKLNITGLANKVISKGLIASTVDKKQFITTETIRLNAQGEGTSKIEAYEAGLDYNVEANTITEIVTVVNGVISVTNPDKVSGGSITETDEELRERLLLKARTPSTSGNIHHFKQWSLEIDGTGDAKVFPNYFGAGTVMVAIVDSNKEPANEEIVKDVYDNIENNRPIGAVVTVQSARAVDINIEVTIKRDLTYTPQEVEESINANLLKVMRDMVFKQDYISYARLTSVILTAKGVLDFIELRVNGELANNVSLESDQVGVLGTLTINEV